LISALSLACLSISEFTLQRILGDKTVIAVIGRWRGGDSGPWILGRSLGNHCARPTNQHAAQRKRIPYVHELASLARFRQDKDAKASDGAFQAVTTRGFCQGSRRI
jgi:hypothetical protein